MHESVSESEVAQSCLTLCDPMDCSLPGSSIHGIFQARVLKWVAISFSRGSSQPMDWTLVSRIASRHFTIWATREGTMGEAHKSTYSPQNFLKYSKHKYHWYWVSRAIHIWEGWCHILNFSKNKKVKTLANPGWTTNRCVGMCWPAS